MKMYEMCYSKKIHSASVKAEATTLIFCGSYVTENNKKAKTYRYPQLFALIKIKSFENFLEIIKFEKRVITNLSSAEYCKTNDKLQTCLITSLQN